MVARGTIDVNSNRFKVHCGCSALHANRTLRAITLMIVGVSAVDQ